MATKTKSAKPANVKTTECPVSRETFRAKAPRAIAVTINGKSFDAEIKEFKTGSFGFLLQGKTNVDVDGQPVTMQIGLNLIAVGSKDLPK